MTGNRIGDAPVLPDLLAQVPLQERIGSVTADGIYDTKDVTPPSRPEGPMPSYRRDGMPGSGRATIPACRRETKRYVPASGSGGPTGRKGPDITDEVASRPR